MGPLLFTSIQKADLSLPVGGIVASYSFLMKDAPKYRPGYTIIVSFLCVSIASIVGYYVAVTAENRRRIRDNNGSDDDLVLHFT